MINSDIPEISLIIPAFNEEELIENTLKVTTDYLEHHHAHSEIWVVNDGSTDGTAFLTNNFIALNTSGINIHILNNDINRGKGFSIRHGVKHASGDIIILYDADLPYELIGIESIKLLIDQGFDGAVGSRLSLDSSTNVKIPFIRALASFFYRRFVHLLFSIDVEDSQCGFKGFSRKPAKKIFSATSIDGFGFDIEAIAIATKFGYKITNFPVNFVNQRQKSKINIVRDSLKMLKDLILVKIRMSRMD